MQDQNHTLYGSIATPESFVFIYRSDDPNSKTVYFSDTYPVNCRNPSIRQMLAYTLAAAKADSSYPRQSACNNITPEAQKWQRRSVFYDVEFECEQDVVSGSRLSRSAYSRGNMFLESFSLNIVQTLLKKLLNRCMTS